MGAIDSIINKRTVELRKAAEKLGRDINAGINHGFKAHISVSPVQVTRIKKDEYHLSIVATVTGTHYPSLFKNYNGADLV